MGIKHAAAFAALMAACAPACAFDGAQTIFYVSIPLDRQFSGVSLGLRLQGGREHQVIDLDRRMLRLLDGNGIEPGWMIVGAVVVGLVAARNADKQAAAQAAAPAPPPCHHVCE
jgi:hypothetical protein